MKHCLNIALKNTPQQTSVFKNGKLFILWEEVLIWTQIQSSFWLEGKNKFSFIAAAGETKMSEMCPSVGSSDTYQSHFQACIELCQYLHLVSVIPHSSSMSTELTSQTDMTPAVLNRLVAFKNIFLKEQGQRYTAFSTFLKSTTTIQHKLNRKYTSKWNRVRETVVFYSSISVLPSIPNVCKTECHLSSWQSQYQFMVCLFVLTSTYSQFSSYSFCHGASKSACFCVP